MQKHKLVFKLILRSICYLFALLFITNIYATPVNNTDSQPTQTSTYDDTQQKSTVQNKAKEIQQEVRSLMSSLTPTERSALEERLKKEQLIFGNPFGITLYKPTYILPFYYTASPYDTIYEGVSPNNQKLMPAEFKAQLSLQAPIWNNILGQYSSLNIAFSQVVYWQFYVESQYFREINCDAEAFIRKRIIPNWWIILGAVHQSNGRGGELERSWNRAYVDLKFSGEKWMVSLKPWILIFKPQSSELHNPDIAHYLGYGRILVAYKFHNNNTISLMARNLIASQFKRATFELSGSFPIHRQLKLFVQIFSGYGQSLIEYDHRTNSIGIGIAFNDWI